MAKKDECKKTAKDLAEAKRRVKELIAQWGDKTDVTNPEAFVESQLVDWYVCCKALSYYLSDTNPFKKELLTTPKDAKELRDQYSFTARLAALKQINEILEFDASGTESTA